MTGNQVFIDHVSKHFGDFTALDDVSITIKNGEFFSLLGPSGCGKTTLLRIIAGFDFPDNGAVLFDGKNIISSPPNRRHANTIFQNYALFSHLSVYDNIAFPLSLRKVNKNIIDAKVKEYLHLVQLDDHIHKMPNQLSGGQKQRVAIARALINEPKVLLLDEPLSALDAKLRSNLLVDLDNLHEQIGITFIYVTHDQSEALSVSDHIAVMNQGHVLQIGSPYEIYESPKTRFTAQFIGDTNLFESTVEKSLKHVVEGQDSDYMVTLKSSELGESIQVTDYEHTEPGQTVALTVRPEKIRITKENPLVEGRNDINIFKGIVEEPIYSGFQSKFYVKLQNGTTIKIFKQHTNYLDNGPLIQWKDEVYISWAANDGYIVKEPKK